MPATSAKKQETDNGYIFTRAKLLRARRAVRTRNGEVEGYSRQLIWQLATLPGALKHNWQTVGDNVDKAADEKSEKRNEAEKKSRVAD